MNQVIIMGRVSSDIKTKSFDNGNAVTNFSVATDESYKDKKTGERVDQAEFHNICMYGSLGEVVAKYFKKGQRILITGKIKTRSWETTTGDKRYVTEIIGNGFEFIEKAEKSSNNSDQYQSVASNEEDTDNLPF